MGSNLLYKASIITTPTAYGVGVLNSIKPALVTFNSLASFTNGTTYPLTTFTSSGNNVTSGIVSSAFGGCVSNAIELKKNQKVKVRFDYTQNSGNELRVLISNAVSGAGTSISDFTTINATGSFEHTFNITSDATGYLQLGTGSSSNSINFSALNVTAEVLSLADFDFTRNSSATRVNPDYLIETVSINSANLVQNGNFSELGSELVTNGDFATDSDWTKTQAIIQNGQAIITSPDGSYAAIYQSGILTSGKTYYYSVNVKSISGTMQFVAGSGTNIDVTTTGVKTGYITANGTTIFEIKRKSGAGAFSATIDNVSVKQVDPNDNWSLSSDSSISQGFANVLSTGTYQYILQSGILTVGKKYKVEYTILSGSTGDLKLGTSLGVTPITSTVGTHSIIATALTTDLYIERETVCNVNITDISVIEIQENGVPRLDYTNGTASILLENQSTNVIGNSENLIDGGAGWINQLGGTVDDNQFSEISGKNDAWKLNKASGTFKSLRLQQTLSSSTYTLSWYLKQGNINKAQFRFDGGLGAQYVLFDLLEGTHTDNANLDNIQINSAGGGWYRCQATITTNLTNVHLYIDDSTVSSAAGYIYAQYPQIEALTYSTSYIPTSGSSVTRAAETLNNAGNSDLINSTEGVLYAEIKTFSESGSAGVISLNDGSNTNRVKIELDGGQIKVRIDTTAGQVASLNYTIAITNYLKIAVKWKADDYALWINGIEGATDTSGASFVADTLSKLSFDRGDGGEDFYGRCKSVAVFKEALSDTELACLTSTNNREIFLNYYYRMQYVGANTEAVNCAQIKLNV
ncbi:hypothetical protein N9245_00130 [bacterium]|nr:hypothetical protein [bacterium]MDB4541720.1 hypothetical protein [bacterium]